MLNFSKIYWESFFYEQNQKWFISTSVFIFSIIFGILKTKFYVFWSQTSRNWTKFSEMNQKLPYYIKYNKYINYLMSLIFIIIQDNVNKNK